MKYVIDLLEENLRQLEYEKNYNDSDYPAADFIKLLDNFFETKKAIRILKRQND